MATSAVWVKVDGERVVQAFEEAREKLASGHADMVVDFSSVHRIDSGALRAIECLADTVDAEGTKLVLSNVNIQIYKVLKLTKLAARLTFRT